MVFYRAKRSIGCSSCVTPRLGGNWLQRLVLVMIAAVSVLLTDAVHAAVAPVASSAGVAVEAQMLVDPTGHLDLDTVIQRFSGGAGQPVAQQQAMPLEGSQAIWYRLVLPPAVPAAPQFLLVPYPGLDSAELYTSDASSGTAGSWQTQRSGDSRAVSQWPVSNLYPVFKLSELPGERAPAYLRISNVYPLSVSWMVIDALAFQSHIKGWYLLLGIYMGLIMLMFIVSCVQGVTWQEPIHFLFAAFVAVTGLAQLAASGVAGEYFWPQLAWWNDRSLSTLPIASSVVLLLFFHRLLAERASAAALRGFFVVAVLGLMALGGSLAPDRAPFIPYFAPYYIAGLVTYMAAAGWYAWRKPRVGIWLVAAVVCLASGAIFPIARLLDLTPSTMATQFGAQVGAALQIPLLMIALFFRSRERRGNLARIGSLERTDPLTGMGNHKALLQQLARVSGSSGGAAVMRVRITNIRPMRMDYGLEVAQASVVLASALAMAAIQEGDAVARHREGDLVLVFKGPVTREWLQDAGQHLIARGLAGAPSLPAQVGLQFQIAVLMAPFESTEPTGLLHLLEMLISGMSQRSGTGLRIAAMPVHKTA